MKRSRELEDVASDDEHARHRLESESPRASKIVDLDGSAIDDEPSTMRCSLPPHKDALSFKTFDEFESHYNKVHMNRCLECHKNFPSAHILSLHIEECHDPLVAVQRDRGEHTFSCFVEDCERKCRTPQKRRMHLIDKHQYPKNYFFALTKEGVDGRRSLLLESGHGRRRSSTSSTLKDSRRRASILQQSTGERAAQDGPAAAGPSSGRATGAVPEDAPDTEMDELAGAMSSLQFIPSSVRFGRGKGKSGFAKS